MCIRDRCHIIGLEMIGGIGMKLCLIKDTVQKVAEAITAALEIETEIVDENLEIIGGTNFFQFLRIMADLIASKLAMTSMNDSMKITLDSMLTPMGVSTSFFN